MKLFWEYILPRVVQWFVVVFVGVSVTFLIPRLSPQNPVDNAIGRLTTFQTINPDATLALRESLMDLYGLEGSLPEQYFRFWGRLLHGDLGPSFTSFPTPVTQMIGTGLRWTVGLLGTAIIISWLLGVILGSLAGYFPDRLWAKVLQGTLVTIYPVPYYILAYILLMIFTFYWPLFPLVGGSRGTPGFTWDYISSLFYFGFLPALSIVSMFALFELRN
jgi:peptide/nickel transport system permease protein